MDPVYRPNTDAPLHVDIPTQELYAFPAVFSVGRRLHEQARRRPMKPSGSPDHFTVRILLNRGGIHPHPGPSTAHPCSVCSGRVTWAGVSFLCNQCDLWVHRRCSGLSLPADYTSDWVCPVCFSAPMPVLGGPAPVPRDGSPTAALAPPSLGAPLSFPLLQFNCNGIQHCTSELSHLLTGHCVLIAAIQETKLSAASKPPSFPSYTLVRRDRPGVGRGGGGGLAFLVHHSIHFTNVSTDHLFPGDNTLEHQAISATMDGTPYQIYNLYIPPATSCPPSYIPDLSNLLEQDNNNVLIVGDFNAHNPAWYSSTQDDRAAARGNAIVTAIDSSSLVLLNEDHPTRLPTSGRPSSPDLTLISCHLALDAQWIPLVRLNSDHLPIAISLNSLIPPEPSIKRTYTNYRKADWDSFTRSTERAFQSAILPSSCSVGVAFFGDILRKSARSHIPRGCLRDFIPNLPAAAIPLVRERDNIRALNPQDPRLTDLNNNITSAIATNSRQTWINKVESTNFRQNPSSFWSLLKKLSGKPQQPPNQPVTFNHRTLTSSSLIAQSFCKQFTLVSNYQRNRSHRRVRRHIKKKHPLTDTFPDFTPNEVKLAIQGSGNSTATGPDDLNILHLRYLGPHGVCYLTRLFNLSIRHANLPSIWKAANIIVIPKPGKPPALSTSYRPISLLCPAVKVLERLVLPLLTAATTLNDSQHGFRPLHSTTTALLPLTQTIANGFNEPRPPLRTIAMAIDFSKAFDTVPHTQLISQIASLPLHSNIIRWLSCYLNGRTARCIYRNQYSSYYPVHAGVPQGSVISPALFNLFVSDYPNTAPLISSYADDFTAAASAVQIPEAANCLSTHSAEVAAWARRKGLTVSIAKSHSTLFTSDTHQSRVDPHVAWEGADLPLCRTPKILGVTLDPHFTFTPHINTVCERARSRLNILKSLTGSSWGQQKEIVTITYKALIKSIITYAAPVWFPNASNSAIAKLQSIQNAALRIATGSHKMASASHLHSETEILPISDSLSLLCSQFLLSALRPDHPSFPVVTHGPGPRNMKQTLQSRFLPSIAQHLTMDGTSPAASYRQNLKTLHTAAVRDSIDATPPNRILGIPPPTVSPSERLLSRSSRCTLSQLRSGFSVYLRSYQARIGSILDPLCPECLASEHTTDHLFNCPSHPTALTPTDLWTSPTEAVAFLATLPSFSHLQPALDRPPPEPPPSPPPP